MARYRVMITYTAQEQAEPGRALRFVGKLGGGNLAAARQRGLALLRELGLAAGIKFDSAPTAEHVFIEGVEPRAEVLLEVGALEFTPGTFCMSLTGPLDSVTALRLDQEVYRLQSLGARALAIDFSHVHPFTSAGLGVLLNLNDRLAVHLVKFPANARKLLQTLGLEPSLAIHNSFPEALHALQGRLES